jgi:hypothetical protein
MTIADIKGTIGDYATAAQNARAAGFDGVEVHAGTTYLLPEFLNSALNGAVTLPCEERKRSTPADFQAAATASRHVVIDAARSTRCD